MISDEQLARPSNSAMSLNTQCLVQKQPATISISNFYRRFVSFPAAITAILIGKAFWTCREGIVDTDLGWHLRNGQYLLSHWQLPTCDSYSFTAAGSAWIDHSWLSEVLYYCALRIFGLRGVFLLFLFAVTAFLLTVFFVTLKRASDPLSAGVLTIFGGLLAMVGFTPRAQNFGWLCFAGVFAILLRFRDSRRGPLWLIPIIFGLWINCHASWPFGLAVFAIIFASGIIQRDLGRMSAAPWSGSEKKKLTITLAASVFVLFVNPFGYRLVLYPFDLALRQAVNVSLGGEWASVDFNDPRGIYVLIALAAVFTLALMPRRPWRIDDVLLTAFALICGLKHIRFLMVTGIVLPPILARQFPPLSTYDPSRERRLLNFAIVAVVIAVLIAGFPSNQYLEAEFDQFFPANAVRYLATHPQQGNLLNQYEWGGYLEWKLPDVKTFIDSRTDIFEYRGVLRDYVAISTFNHTQELLDRYKIGYVFYPANSPLSYFLSKDPGWECAFQDDQAAIYRRVTR
jgi:hypothetical protein